MLRFKIGDVVYLEGSPADVTLRDLLLVEQETAELGRPINMGEIVRLSEAFKKLTPDQAKVHPDAAFMLGITIWLAKIRKLRESGDLSTRVSFLDAVDFPMSEFTPLPATDDREPVGKARTPAKPRKGSPAAGGRRTGKAGSPGGSPAATSAKP